MASHPSRPNRSMRPSRKQREHEQQQSTTKKKRQTKIIRHTAPNRTSPSPSPSPSPPPSSRRDPMPSVPFMPLPDKLTSINSSVSEEYLPYGMPSAPPNSTRATDRDNIQVFVSPSLTTSRDSMLSDISESRHVAISRSTSNANTYFVSEHPLQLSRGRSETEYTVVSMNSLTETDFDFMDSYHGGLMSDSMGTSTLSLTRMTSLSPSETHSIATTVTIDDPEQLRRLSSANHLYHIFRQLDKADWVPLQSDGESTYDLFSDDNGRWWTERVASPPISPELPVRPRYGGLGRGQRSYDTVDSHEYKAPQERHLRRDDTTDEEDGDDEYDDDDDDSDEREDVVPRTPLNPIGSRSRSTSRSQSKHSRHSNSRSRSRSRGSDRSGAGRVDRVQFGPPTRAEVGLDRE